MSGAYRKYQALYLCVGSSGCPLGGLWAASGRPLFVVLLGPDSSGLGLSLVLGLTEASGWPSYFRGSGWSLWLVALALSSR